LRATALRATAFLAARFGASFFLTAVFLLVLVFAEIFAFAALRDTVFCTTALFAFGRVVLAAVVGRFFAVDFGEARCVAEDLGDERRTVAREVERLRPLVTALIWLKVERAYAASSAPEVAAAE
jgi:hypothetical protein